MILLPYVTETLGAQHHRDLLAAARQARLVAEAGEDGAATSSMGLMTKPKAARRVLVLPLPLFRRAVAAAANLGRMSDNAQPWA